MIILFYLICSIVQSTTFLLRLRLTILGAPRVKLEITVLKVYKKEVKPHQISRPSAL